MPIRKILVALDSSPRAPAVRDAALELAQAMGAKLVLVRAVDIPIEWSQQMFSVSLEALEHGHNIVERVLGTTASRLIQQAPCNVLLVRADLPKA